MLDAHVEAGIMVGLPFGHPGIYDFGSHGGLTRRVSELGAVMLKHRLTPVSAVRARYNGFPLGTWRVD
jgi:aarF domain-containing kinase